MPLTGEPNKDIPELINSGRPQKQAVAIALKEERGDVEAEDCDDVADSAKKDSELTLLDMVDRLRQDMADKKSTLDKLTEKMYTASHRIRSLEE